MVNSIIPFSFQHTNVSVGHRFKHFDWLYERLVEKFPCISVPPLPDKQLSGRYSEDLVMKRRYLLEKWMNRIAAHPVLSASFVFSHFVTVCSENREKVGYYVDIKTYLTRTILRRPFCANRGSDPRFHTVGGFGSTRRCSLSLPHVFYSVTFFTA